MNEHYNYINTNTLFFYKKENPTIFNWLRFIKYIYAINSLYPLIGLILIDHNIFDELHDILNEKIDEKN